MNSRILLCALKVALPCALIVGAPLAFGKGNHEDDWPQWRGAMGDGKAAGSQAPLEWGPDKNVIWESKVPGRGHSSPTVSGDQVFLTTAIEPEQIQAVIAFDRATGAHQWQTTLFKGGFDEKAHERNSQATCTVACAGDRVFASFMNDRAVWIVALDRKGKEMWRKQVGQFVSFWGYSSSPTIYKSTLLIAADHSEGGYIAALDQATGNILWKQQRPHQRNYPSPVVHHVSGRDQLLLAGCDRFASYDPNTGELLWEAEATTEECVGTAVVSGGLAFASGGYPVNVTCAVNTDGSGKVAWRNNTKIYVPSLLSHEGLLFGITDNGIAYCWQAETGEEMWKKRLGGVFNASPTLVGNAIVAVAEDGTAHVFQAQGESYQPLAENHLGDEVYATPTFCGDCAYMRVAKYEGEERQEYLYCLGVEQ